MKIGLFRHAEKQNDWSSDPGLSPRGEGQAYNLIQWVKEGRLLKPDILLVSPKKRSLLTFAPLAKELGIPLQKMDDLDERKDREDPASFKLRVSKVLEAFTADSPHTVFLCSHLDWIEEFSHVVPSDTDLRDLAGFSWSPTAFLIFEIEVLWHLTQKGKVA